MWTCCGDPDVAEELQSLFLSPRLDLRKKRHDAVLFSADLCCAELSYFVIALHEMIYQANSVGLLDTALSSSSDTLVSGLSAANKLFFKIFFNLFSF